MIVCVYYYEFGVACNSWFYFLLILFFVTVNCSWVFIV